MIYLNDGVSISPIGNIARSEQYGLYLLCPTSFEENQKLMNDGFELIADKKYHTSIAQWQEKENKSLDQIINELMALKSNKDILIYIEYFDWMKIYFPFLCACLPNANRDYLYRLYNLIHAYFDLNQYRNIDGYTLFDQDKTNYFSPYFRMNRVDFEQYLNEHDKVIKSIKVKNIPYEFDIGRSILNGKPSDRVEKMTKRILQKDYIQLFNKLKLQLAITNKWDTTNIEIKNTINNTVYGRYLVEDIDKSMIQKIFKLYFETLSIIEEKVFPDDNQSYFDLALELAYSDTDALIPYHPVFHHQDKHIQFNQFIIHDIIKNKNNKEYLANFK